MTARSATAEAGGLRARRRPLSDTAWGHYDGCDVQGVSHRPEHEPAHREGPDHRLLPAVPDHSVDAVMIGPRDGKLYVTGGEGADFFTMQDIAG